MARRSTVTGARELDRVLKLLPRQIAGKALDAAVRAGAAPIRKAVKARAPVSEDGAHGRRPGFLRKSITARKVSASAGGVRFGHYRIGVGKAFYGLFIEFGTSTKAARPFLRPAFEETARAALEIIGVKLGQNIEKAAKKLAGRFKDSGLKARRKRRR